MNAAVGIDVLYGAGRTVWMGSVFWISDYFLRFVPLCWAPDAHSQVQKTKLLLLGVNFYC